MKSRVFEKSHIFCFAFYDILNSWWLFQTVFDPWWIMLGYWSKMFDPWSGSLWSFRLHPWCINHWTPLILYKAILGTTSRFFCNFPWFSIKNVPRRILSEDFQGSRLLPKPFSPNFIARYSIGTNSGYFLFGTPPPPGSRRRRFLSRRQGLWNCFKATYDSGGS